MKNWPLWEVFIRSKNGLEHRHCGSLHASDATMALENARDVYTRRNVENVAPAFEKGRRRLSKDKKHPG